MRLLLRRAKTVGLILFGLVLLLALVDIAFGERSWLDISVVIALAALSVGTFLALRSVQASLSTAVAAREELQVRLGQQQAVARLGRLALTDVSRQYLLDEACLTVAAVLHADLAGVLQLLPDRSAFVLRAGIGWPPNEIGVQHVPAGPRSQAGYTVASDGPVVLHDVAAEERFELSSAKVARGVKSGVSTGIGSNGETYGVLGAHTYHRREFTEHDVTFLEAVASVLASALRRGAAEEKAEQTHHMLEAVTEGTTDDFFVKDLDGRIIALNASAAQTLGRPRDELIGKTLHEVLPSRIADTLTETDRVILEQGRVETLEETVTLNGKTTVLLSTKGPYRDADGALLGTFGVARDITERKTQERELARSEERFRLAQEGARMGTWDIDLVTGVRTWSDGLRTIYGVDAAYPAGLEHFAPLIHPDDRAVILELVTDAYARGIDLEFECRIIRPDGGLRWLLARLSSIRSEHGAPARVLGIVVDITERKLAGEKLARSEETLRLAQAAAGLGAWDWNVETGDLLWTADMYEIFGVEPASFVPSLETMYSSLHPDDRSTVDAAIQRALASGESLFECPCRVVQPSGSTRWVMNRGTIMRSADGSPKRMVGITIDETERKAVEVERAELENRLRQAEKLEALGQLAGGVAHDFNNLLVAIRGYSELARARLEHGEEGVAGDIDGVLAAADRAAGLTKQLLAFGRRQVLDPEVLDLNEVVRATDALLRRVIGDRVLVVTTLTEQPVLVKADRGQLEQVIMNLAINGRDAMPHGGVLTIRVASADPEVDGALLHHAMLSITDEGSGIDPKTASHMFEPFFTTKGEKGTGLGLATVHGIVAQSGGQVLLDTTLGRGSRFSVYLPLCEEEQLSLSPAPPPAGSKEGTETILLVEDDPTVRSIVSLMLAARGYEILDVADGEAAVVRFETREHPVHLVISDLIMHGLDGRQTIDRIRAIDPATRVLYMSGYSDDAVIRTGGLTAGTGFIQKPFSGDELAARVRELLDGVAA